MYVKNLIDIYDSFGRRIDTDALGLLGLRLQIPSPSYKTLSQEIDGHSGITITDRILQPRRLLAEFLTLSDNYSESLSLRNRLYNLLSNHKYFFIAESEMPSRRWKVYADEWTPQRRSVKINTFEIPLVCEGGFSESTTPLIKRYTTSSFRFNNQGDLTIDPRIHSEFKIDFTGVSNNLLIRNNTTGDEWYWVGSTTSSDSISLSGIRSLKNGSSIFGQTNKRLLRMEPGWNDFELFGTSEPFILSINSRFYYL